MNVQLIISSFLNFLTQIANELEKTIAQRKDEFMAPIILREKVLKWSENCIEVSHLLFF